MSQEGAGGSSKKESREGSAGTSGAVARDASVPKAPAAGAASYDQSLSEPRVASQKARARERAEENKASGQVRSRQISAIQDVIVAALVSSPSETAYLSTAACKELLLNPRVSAIMADYPPDTQTLNLRKKIARHLDIWILRRHAALSADFCTIPCCAACPSGDISDLPSPRLDLTSAFGACTYTPPASSPRICSSTRCPLLNLPPCDIMSNILQRARTVPSSRLWQHSGSHRLYKEALRGPRLFVAAGGTIFRLLSTTRTFSNLYISSCSWPRGTRMC